ncbi:MAG: hypothetical protein IKB25_09365 [Lentisphaeria bacterium]|nr:hypothetical protein [Lentisphaeria bacterium]
MKILVGSLLLLSALIVDAQDLISFSEFVDENGHGLEILSKLEEEKIKNKKFYTTHDCVDDAYEKVRLITVLLNEAVIRHVRKLPVKDGLIVLKSHQQWWKYFAATPSLPNINGSARGIYSLLTDFLRIKARWEALKLPFEQYLIYAKIANLCQVRLGHGTYKMRFGEICLKKEACWAYDEGAVKTHGKYYHDFPVGLLPETCYKTSKNYIAVMSSGRQFYLCIWDRCGIVLAVYPLVDATKIIKVSIINENGVEIVFQSNTKKNKIKTFSINKNNQIKIQPRGN